MIISQLREVRTSFKAFAHAQSQASEDILKWSTSHENRAIAETFGYLAELSLLWTEVQREFSGNLCHDMLTLWSPGGLFMVLKMVISSFFPVF